MFIAKHLLVVVYCANKIPIQQHVHDSHVSPIHYRISCAIVVIVEDAECQPHDLAAP